MSDENILGKFSIAYSNGEYMFPVIEVIEFLDVSKNPVNYWKNLQKKLKKKGIVLFLKRMKVLDENNNYIPREVANINDLMYILNFIPSQNAEFLIDCLEQTEDHTLKSINWAFEKYYENDAILHHRTNSGVLYVSKSGNSWVYNNGKKSIQSKKLFDLENKVKRKNFEWIVKNEADYEDNLSAEWDDNEYCILNEILN